MALKKCEECGEKMSDKARECPHCGYAIPMEEKETALKFYEIAHREIVSRLRIRSGALIAFIMAAGVIFGVGFSAKEHEILLIIPFLSLGCAMIFAHHNSMITALLDYTNSISFPIISQSIVRFERSKSWDFIETAYQQSICSYLIPLCQ